MKIVNSALILFITRTASAKLNAPEDDRKLQFDGMEMPEGAEAAIADAQEAIGDLLGNATLPEGMDAETSAATLEEALAEAQEAIGDLLGNATLPEGTTSLPGDLNSTLEGLADALGSMMNGTSFLPGDLNGTLGGFMPEGGLGLEIPEGDFTQMSCPDTCPQAICDNIAMSGEGVEPDEVQQEALKEAMVEACEAGSIGDCFGGNIFAFVCEMQCAEGVDPSQFGISAEDIASTCNYVSHYSSVI